MRTTPQQVLVAMAVLFVAVLFQYWMRLPPSNESAPPKLKPGPIRHEKLPDALVERIRKFEPVFAEVYPDTHEQWLDGFQRDAHPESEVAIWEAMAFAYQTFTEKRSLNMDAKKEAFGLLIVRSAASEQQTLARNKLKHLSRAEAEGAAFVLRHTSAGHLRETLNRRW